MWRPSPATIYAIQAMKEICESESEVHRFLRACAFYYIWIPHYPQIADALYRLLQKGKKFEWDPELTEVVNKSKKALQGAMTITNTDNFGTYRRMCRFRGGDCRSVLRTLCEMCTEYPIE